MNSQLLKYLRLMLTTIVMLPINLILITMKKIVIYNINISVILSLVINVYNMCSLYMFIVCNNVLMLHI